MKTKSVGILVCAILVILIGSLFFINSRKSNNDFAIGVVAPMTGPAAAFGDSFVKGVQLAAREANPPVKVYFEDDSSDPKKSAMAAQKLINTNHVAVILSTTSGTGNAVAPIAKANNILHLCACTDTRVGDGKNSFTYSPVAQEEAALWIKEAQKRGIKTIAILSQVHPGIAPFVAAVTAQLSSSTPRIVFNEKFNSDQRDFNTLITKARATHPDLYFVMSFPPSLEIIGTKLLEIDKNVKISTDASFGVSARPELFNGQWYVDAWLSDNKFITKFNAAYPGVRFNARTAPIGFDLYSVATKYKTPAAIQKLNQYEGVAGIAPQKNPGNFIVPAALWVIDKGVASVLK